MSSIDRAAAPSIVAIQRRTVGVLVAAQVLAGLGFGSTLAMGAIIAADLAGDAWAGAAVTASTLGTAVAAVPLARVALQRGRRVALASGILFAALGSVLVIVADSTRVFPLLIVGFICLGIGAAVSLQARFAATDLATSTRRGRDLSLVVWSTTVGAVIGPNLFAPGAELAGALGLPANSGAFVIALVAQLATAVMIAVGLRPDPLIVARELVGEHREAGVHVEPTAAQTARRRTTLILVIASIGASHAVMVSVMSMTPVHLTGHGATLVVVGVVISLHVAGMYALSPLFGWWSDRASRILVMAVGYVILATALVVLGLAPNDHTLVAVGLTLLGLGWSAATVAGSALVTDLSNGPNRVRVQGRTDMTMSLSGAAAGALAGPVLALVGYGGLAVVTGVLVAGLLVLAAIIGTRLRAHAA